MNPSPVIDPPTCKQKNSFDYNAPPDVSLSLVFLVS